MTKSQIKTCWLLILVSTAVFSIGCMGEKNIDSTPGKAGKMTSRTPSSKVDRSANRSGVLDVTLPDGLTFGEAMAQTQYRDPVRVSVPSGAKTAELKFAPTDIGLLRIIVASDVMPTLRFSGATYNGKQGYGESAQETTFFLVRQPDDPATAQVMTNR